MKRVLKTIASLSAAALLLLPAANANEAVCKPQKVKKVSRLSVFLINQTGAPEPNVHLRVFDGEQEIAAGVTGNDGKFSFDDLKAGSYQVKIHGDGFQEDAFPIVITNSGKNCTRAVQILLFIGWLPCPGMVHLMKP
jgi:hypothetical protein